MDAEKILVDNLREALGASQRYFIFAITASLSLLLLELALIGGGSTAIELQGLVVATDPGIARMVLFGAIFILPVMAISANSRANKIAKKISNEELREAALTYPSLATEEEAWLRIGSAILPIVLTTFSQILRLFSQTEMNWSNFISGLLVVALPSLSLAYEIRSPVGSPSSSPKPDGQT
jgi:hypothetical protein